MQTYYVTMRDGVRIAADVLRPPAGKFDESRGLPCVLLQTRWDACAFNCVGRCSCLTCQSSCDAMLMCRSQSAAPHTAGCMKVAVHCMVTQVPAQRRATVADQEAAERQTAGPAQSGQCSSQNS